MDVQVSPLGLGLGCGVDEPDEEYYDEQIEEMPQTFKYIGVHTNLADKGKWRRLGYYVFVCLFSAYCTW
jgi:hypothetical protein